MKTVLVLRCATLRHPRKPQVRFYPTFCGVSQALGHAHEKVERKAARRARSAPKQTQFGTSPGLRNGTGNFGFTAFSKDG